MCASDPTSWDYVDKVGDWPDDEFSSRYVQIIFEESRALADPRRGDHLPPHLQAYSRTEWRGILVSLARLQALPPEEQAPPLLPEDPSEHEEAAGRISNKIWIPAEVERMKRAGETWSGITDFSRKVHKRMRAARRVDDRINLIGMRSIERLLRELGLFKR
jgi:hypothetical protein